MSAELKTVGKAPGSVEGIELRTVALTAGYGDSPVVQQVSIAVEPGEVVSIVGPNGSGKSTLLKSIVGVGRGPLRPGAGGRQGGDRLGGRERSPNRCRLRAADR